MGDKNPCRDMKPIEAIREKCLWCKNTPNNVRLCPKKLCPLYPFRFGREPGRAEKEAQKAEA